MSAKCTFNIQFLSAKGISIKTNKLLNKSEDNSILLLHSRAVKVSKGSEVGVKGDVYVTLTDEVIFI